METSRQAPQEWLRKAVGSNSVFPTPTCTLWVVFGFLATSLSDHPRSLPPLYCYIGGVQFALSRILRQWTRSLDSSSINAVSQRNTYLSLLHLHSEFSLCIPNLASLERTWSTNYTFPRLQTTYLNIILIWPKILFFFCIQGVREYSYFIVCFLFAIYPTL